MKSLHKLLLMTTAFEKEGEAETCLLYLLENRLAACGHVYREKSAYHWNGSLHNGHEWVLSIKTLESLWADAEEAIKAIHPYDVPMIIGVPIEHVNAEYADWVAETCHVGHE